MPFWWGQTEELMPAIQFCAADPHDLRRMREKNASLVDHQRANLCGSLNAANTWSGGAGMSREVRNVVIGVSRQQSGNLDVSLEPSRSPLDMPIGVIPHPPANFRSICRFGPAPVSARSASCRTEVFLRRLDAAGS